MWLTLVSAATLTCVDRKSNIKQKCGHKLCLVKNFSKVTPLQNFALFFFIVHIIIYFVIGIGRYSFKLTLGIIKHNFKYLYLRLK